MQPAKKRKFPLKTVIVLSVIAVLIVVIAISASNTAANLFEEEVAKTQDLETYYSFDGFIEAAHSQNVLSTMNLSVKTFYVKEGDMVKAGDLLFELDDSNIANSLDQSAAAVELAKIGLTRAAGTTRQQQLSSARLNLTNAQSAYNAATGVSKSQQETQAQAALDSAKLSFDSAETALSRISALYDAGAVALVDLEQAETAYDGAKIQLDSAQSAYDSLSESIAQSTENARAALDAAQENYDILLRSVDENIRSAEEQVKQAEASYNTLLKQSEDMNVTAEVSGEVTDIHVEENETLIMGTHIMNIVDYNELEVAIRVDEYDLAAVALGKETLVTINALELEVLGTVSDIAGDALVVNGVSYFPTRITLNAVENLRVGLSAEIRILNRSAKDATTISMKALQFDNENKPYVFYNDEGGNMQMKYVTVGISDGLTVQILEGLSPGETVLVPSVTFEMPMMMGRA